MENMKGYTVLTNTVSGWELAWKVEDGDSYMPDIYNSIKEARKAIADILITQLQEYQDDERDWDQIDYDIDNIYCIAQIGVYEDEIRLIEPGGSEWTLSLTEWRASI